MNPEKENALNESLAMTKLTIDLLNQKKKDSLRLWIVIIIMIIVNLVEAGLFVWYELQYEDVSTVTTTTTTEDIDQNAESGNNVYQAGENAQNTCAITNAIHAEGEQTRALIQTNEIQALRDKVADLQLAQSQCAQNAYLVDKLQPVARPAYITCSPYATNTCGYGCGNYSM